MDALQGLLFGFSVALRPENLLAALLGAALGTAVGVLPGIGVLGTMALLLPLAINVGPATAVILLAGIYYGAMYGGSTTAILLRIPGESGSIVTTFDGYAMSQQGRAGAALTVSAVGSFIAGTVSVFGVALFAPTLGRWALSFSSPEFFALSLLGLVTLIQVSGGSALKAWLMALIGIALTTVGIDRTSGSRRFDAGNNTLLQGFDLVPIAIGLFGVAEIIRIVQHQGGVPKVAGVSLRELWPSVPEWLRALPAMLRGSAIGFLLGLIPGPATVTSTFGAYAVEKAISRRRHEFGQGAIEGVAAPEAANNAASASGLVPVLALGIPFTPNVVMLLAALILQGITPGPLLLQQHPEVVWGLLASMYVGNVALVILNLPLVGLWVRLLQVPPYLLASGILLVCMVGTYNINNSLFDLWVVLAMGVLGYALRILGFDPTPLILGVVLGPIVEKSFREALFMSSGDPTFFFTRPISGSLLAITAAIALAPVVWRLVRARRLAA